MAAVASSFILAAIVVLVSHVVLVVGIILVEVIILVVGLSQLLATYKKNSLLLVGNLFS